MKDQEELIEWLTEQGYKQVREIPGRGLCGLKEFMFTIGICEGLTEQMFEGRWCYPKEIILEAALAYGTWDGVSDPAGDWIKYKGKTEYSNPKLKS